MEAYKNKLINKPEAFLRETFEGRMKEYEFRNIERIEKFLWDLELFLHIQEILGARIVLKGGAAIQFYLPIEAQRTSVDIDMLFCGEVEEIEDALNKITNYFDSDYFFQFNKHMPEKPKTTLPLYTYFVNVPSVLTNEELRRGENKIATQEVKVEFIVGTDEIEYITVKGNEIFAVNSELEYQILPLNALFADKLTTLGPNTVGVQDIRLDEQVKQFYDIWMLILHHFSELNFKEIKEKYLIRAIKEMEERKGIFLLEVIMADVRRQLFRYKCVDNGSDSILRKAINDFNGLYLNAKVDFTQQTVACGASLVEMIYEAILEDCCGEFVNTALEVEEMLRFNNFEGKKRGEKINEAKEVLLDKFGSYSCLDLKVLKGKRPIRIFWAVVNKDNLDEIYKIVKEIV